MTLHCYHDIIFILYYGSFRCTDSIKLSMLSIIECNCGEKSFSLVFLFLFHKTAECPIQTQQGTIKAELLHSS